LREVKEKICVISCKRQKNAQKPEMRLYNARQRVYFKGITSKDDDREISR